MVEREFNKLFKCLRSDNGGDYTSKQFEGYYAKHEIWHEQTVTGTPQYTGVAE